MRNGNVELDFRPDSSTGRVHLQDEQVKLTMDELCRIVLRIKPNNFHFVAFPTENCWRMQFYQGVRISHAREMKKLRGKKKKRHQHSEKW